MACASTYATVVNVHMSTPVFVRFVVAAITSIITHGYYVYTASESST